MSSFLVSTITSGAFLVLGVVALVAGVVLVFNVDDGAFFVKPVVVVMREVGLCVGAVALELLDVVVVLVVGRLDINLLVVFLSSFFSSVALVDLGPG